MSLRPSSDLLADRAKIFGTFSNRVGPSAPRALLVQVAALKSGVDRLVNYAPKFDYNEKQPANGYWSYAKLSVKFVQRLNENFLKNKVIDESMIDVAAYLVTQLKFIERIHRLSIRQTNSNNSSNGLSVIDTRNVLNSDLLSPKIDSDSSRVDNKNGRSDSGIEEDCDDNSEQIDLRRSNCDEKGLFVFDDDLIMAILSSQRDKQTVRQLTSLYGKHNSFWLSRCARRMVTNFCIASSIYSRPIRAILGAGYNWSNEYTNYALTANLNDVRTLWSSPDGILGRFIMPALLYPRTPNITETIYIQRPSTGAWLIHPFTGALVKDRAGLVYERDVRVRCRLIMSGRKSRPAPQQQLILHIHGAAFVAQSPDSHELYLRDWAKKLPNVPIVSVDYSLAPENKWPAAIQDILDVYLWLISGRKSVLDTIGFHPQRIVVTGDSAGAVLALNLVHILADIREEESDVRLPAAVLAAYPVALCQLAMSPSRMFVSVDGLIPTGCLLTSLDAYLFNIEDIIYKSAETPAESELKRLESYETNPGVIGSIWRAAKSALLGEQLFTEAQLVGSNPNERAWYRRSDKHVEFKISEINRKGAHPYASPLRSANYDQFPEVSLYLTVGEFDPFLDDSIALARKWKGPIQLDVIPDLMHGFLYFGLLSEQCRLAGELVIDRLRQALQL